MPNNVGLVSGRVSVRFIPPVDPEDLLVELPMVLVLEGDMDRSKSRFMPFMLRAPGDPCGDPGDPGDPAKLSLKFIAFVLRARDNV